jgi:hypothetical protein
MAREIFRPEYWVYYMPPISMIFYMDCPFLCKQLAKSPSGFPNDLPLSCNRVLGELGMLLAGSWHTPPTPVCYFFRTICIWDMHAYWEA